MVTVVAKLKVTAGSETKFRQAADTMLVHVKANEPGTLTYVLHQSKSDPTEFLYYENYVDQDALKAHGASDAMKQFFGAVGGLLAGRPEITMYDELGGKK